MKLKIIMKQVLIPASIILMSVYCSVAFGQEDSAINEIDKQLQQCLDSSQNYTTYGMIECEVRARDAWDKDLNKYYNLLMQTLSKDEQEKLKSSQRNWLAFSNSESKFSSTMYNNMQGTMWSIAKVQADLNIIKHRALELQAYYNDKTAQ
jgi:uncharacterized protein YecT (DUF1311 family)